LTNTTATNVNIVASKNASRWACEKKVHKFLDITTMVFSYFEKFGMLIVGCDLSKNVSVKFGTPKSYCAKLHFKIL